jgi:hypothetical protein
MRRAGAVRSLRGVIGELVTPNDADRRFVHRCFLSVRFAAVHCVPSRSPGQGSGSPSRQVPSICKRRPATGSSPWHAVPPTAGLPAVSRSGMRRVVGPSGALLVAGSSAALRCHRCVGAARRRVTVRQGRRRPFEAPRGRRSPDERLSASSDELGEGAPEARYPLPTAALEMAGLTVRAARSACAAPLRSTSGR